MSDTSQPRFVLSAFSYPLTLLAFIMAASEYETVANVAWDVMSVDLSATQLLRSMYHNSSVILEALDYFSVQFAPSLHGILRSRTPPTPQQLQLCTLPEIARQC